MCFPATCALRGRMQREVKYFSASCACVGECKEVRFKGTDASHRDTENGVEDLVSEGLSSPVPCVGECNEVRYKGTGRCGTYEIRKRNRVRHITRQMAFP